MREFAVFTLLYHISHDFSIGNCYTYCKKDEDVLKALFFARTERGICSVQNKAKGGTLGFILLIFLFCKSRNINAESVRTAGAANVMLTRLFGQTQNVLAFWTAAVNVRFSVAHTVALKAEKCCEFICKPKKIRVFLAPFIKVLRKISE